jgi:hypothetical protein
MVYVAAPKHQELISLQVAKSKYADPAPEIHEESVALASESTEPDVAPPAHASSAPATLGVKPEELETDPDAWPPNWPPKPPNDGKVRVLRGSAMGAAMAWRVSQVSIAGY